MVLDSGGAPRREAEIGPGELAWSFNHLDPAVAETAYETMGRIRRGCPVARSGELDGFVLVTGYDEIREAAQASDRFSAYVDGLGAAAVVTEMREAVAPMFETDDDHHHQWRRTLMDFFTPAAAAAQDQYVRAICRETLQEMIPRGAADLVSGYTRQVPPLVIGRMLGLAELERAWLSEHVRALYSAETLLEAQQIGRVYADFLLGQIRERRARPGRDLLSCMVAAEVDGRIANEEELVKMTMLMVAAGHLTTADACATAVLQLLENPALRERVTALPVLLEPFVEELVRHEPAVAATGRTVTTHTHLGGLTLEPGDRLLLAWGSANRDERRFDDGDVFRLDRDRSRTPHLGWGSGEHRCLGRHLARVELRVMLDELLRAIPDFQLQPHATVRRTFGVIRGVATLPVQWSRR
ncbi:cytochrome P450 [Amycolatopsis nalaikhensis]|uniref:Cytochrome P450 n=1 Tax=Amycolatopsis nalaikhensis TaxID=715472 RepID=A0ABY8X8X6_9PSEU|nr:cytochrome P450 [Amycolatopsis sp. 2-2]WIV52837.1 cytochrome P450 [Amycolatopsis sp. 2-2]